MARARRYGKDARKALEAFPDSPVKRELIDVVDFCVERAY
jgi:octaprenyl-diphosphate synthase